LTRSYFYFNYTQHRYYDPTTATFLTRDRVCCTFG